MIELTHRSYLCFHRNSLDGISNSLSTTLQVLLTREWNRGPNYIWLQFKASLSTAQRAREERVLPKAEFWWILFIDSLTHASTANTNSFHFSKTNPARERNCAHGRAPRRNCAIAHALLSSRQTCMRATDTSAWWLFFVVVKPIYLPPANIEHLESRFICRPLPKYVNSKVSMRANWLISEKRCWQYSLSLKSIWPPVHACSYNLRDWIQFLLF